MSKKFIFASTTVTIVMVAVSIGVARLIIADAKGKGGVVACVNNLRWIDQAKEEWALEHAEATNAPTWDDLLPYLHGKTNYPVCPAGGVYTIGRRGELPSCSIGSNVVPYHILEY